MTKHTTHHNSNKTTIPTQTTKNRATAYHHGDLRTALIDAAVIMLRTNGESGLSMRKLASHVGVSRTAAYHHFANKEELLCAIAEEGFERFTKILTIKNTEQLEQTSQNHAKKTIKHFVHSYMAFATENAEYYDLMFSGHLWKSTQLTDSLKTKSYASFKAFVTQVERWQKNGILQKNMPALRFAQVCWSALHGMSRLMIDGIYIDNKAMDTMCDSVVDVFFGNTTCQQKMD